MLDNPIKYKYIHRAAISSRIIVLCLQFLSTTLLPLHINDGFKYNENLGGKNKKKTAFDHFVHDFLGGFSNWDGQYFLHIARHGYNYLNTIAFFPLFPELMSGGTWMLKFMLQSWMSFSSMAMIISFIINFYFFVKSSQILYRLVPYFDNGHKGLCTLTVVLFCFNPASIFFSAMYTESLFAFLTLKVLLTLFQGKHYQAILFSSLSAICRSNGLLNFGFCFAFLIKNTFVTHCNKDEHSFARFLKLTLIILLEGVVIGLGLIPFLGFQLFCYQKFCDSEHVFPLPRFCTGMQLPYQYIQSVNWNVGLFRYFEFKQLPNFILAAPVLITLGHQTFPRCLKFIRRVWRHHDFRHLDLASASVHGSLLTIFCFTSMHVQVSTRLILSSCPYLYIFIAKSIRTEIFKFRMRSKASLTYSLAIYGWFLLYFMVGSLAFSAGYPWT